MEEILVGEGLRALSSDPRSDKFMVDETTQHFKIAPWEKETFLN
jgi:hypothetical protein